MLKVAILDDYQNVAQDFVDLKKLSGKYEIEIFNEPFENEEDAVENYADDGPSEIEVVARLRELLKEATDNREIELAYKIERTIDEILEEE